MTQEVTKSVKKKECRFQDYDDNFTDSCHPAEHFTIQKFITTYWSLWDAQMALMVSKETWTDFKTDSGIFASPGKLFFLELTERAVRELNRKRERDNILDTKNEMMRCFMAFNVNGMQEET